MNIIKFILLAFIFFFILVFIISLQKDYIFISYLSILFIVVFSITFFFKKKYIQLFLISFLSSIFMLYLFEIYYSLQDHTLRNLAIKEAQRNNIPYDVRTKKEVYIFEKIEKKNTNVVVPVTGMDFLKFKKNYENTEYLILSGVSKSFNVFCNESGYWTFYNSDRYGFNNPDMVWEKINNQNIILIGDSNVHGGCVSVENSIAGKLRSISNRNVINLGMSSNGPLLNYATFKEFGNFKNSKIFWFYSEENDLQDLKAEFNYQILKNYLDDEDFIINLKKKVKKTDSIAQEIINFNYNSDNRKKSLNFYNILTLQNLRSIISILTNYKLRLIGKIEFENYNTEVLPNFYKILLKLNNEIIKNNSELIFVYKPSREFYDIKVSKKFNKIKNNSKYKDNIIFFLKKNNISFIDLDVEMKKYEKDILSLYPFRIRSHFNSKGQEIISKIINKKIN